MSQVIISAPPFQAPLRIRYLLLCPEHELTPDVPDPFAPGVLGILGYLPKTIPQYFVPVATYQDRLAHGYFIGYWLGVVYDCHAVGVLDGLAQMKSPPLVVVFLSADQEDCFEALANLSCPFVAMSAHREVSERLGADARTGPHAASSPVEFRRVFEEQLASLTSIYRRTGLGEHAALIERCRAAREDHSATMDGVRFTDFMAASSNHHTWRQIGWPTACDEIPVDSPELGERVSGMVHGVRELVALEQALSDFNWKGRSFLGCLPPLVVIAPYHNPRRVRDWMSIGPERVPDELNVRFRALLRAVRWEQDSNDYQFYMQGRGEDGEWDGYLAAMGWLQARLAFLDEVAYLHSAFHYSPCLRLPVKGRSLNRALSPFEIGRFGKTQDHRKTATNIAEAGRLLCEQLPTGVEDLLAQHAVQVVAISDLPVEWMLIGGVPLAVVADVCRMPESPLSSLMAQHRDNTETSFVVEEDILRHTLVVCGAQPGDPVAAGREVLESAMAQGDLPEVSVAACLSREEFRSAVKQHRPQLLIVDSHGRYEDHEVGSCIAMGDDWVDGDYIVNHGLAAPLVLMSCCATAPIYGNENTIAQAFFEAGAKAVTATLLPIRPVPALALYSCVITNLEMAACTALHPNWLSFMSHCVRTSYFHDCVGSVPALV